jgi:serine protease Do
MTVARNRDANKLRGNVMSYLQKTLLTLTTAAVAGATLIGAPAGMWLTARRAQAATVSTPVVSTPAVATPNAPMALPDFSTLVEQYGPAVVNITVTGHVKTQYAPGLRDDDPFSQFFRGFSFPQPRDTPIRGEGSGFIVRADGIVLTNAHVVDNAQQVTVKLTDSREFTAKVLGTDKQSDVAVLRIDAKNLPTVRLGHDTDLKVGQWVVAIGAPFGFDNTVTAGIVSAKQRMLPSSGYVPFIQTDVPINPGNSGGPLFNLKGEVVGINSQIYSGSGGYQGISFAIPIDVAMQVSKQIETKGRVAHGKLGVTAQPVNQALADTFQLDKPRGALVSSVDPEGPAAKSGLQAGDVILEVNGKPIQRSDELPMLIAQSEPGSVAHLTVWRDRSRRSVDVKLGDMEGARVADNDERSTASGKLGIAVRPLTPEEHEQIDSEAGLLVQRASGAAALAGIEAGDVVLNANGKPVKSVEQLRSIVEKSGRHVALLVQRGNARIFVPVALG